MWKIPHMYFGHQLYLDMILLITIYFLRYQLNNYWMLHLLSVLTCTVEQYCICMNSLMYLVMKYAWYYSRYCTERKSWKDKLTLTDYKEAIVIIVFTQKLICTVKFNVKTIINY